MAHSKRMHHHTHKILRVGIFACTSVQLIMKISTQTELPLKSLLSADPQL
jgi:hypothetical protein